MGEAGRKTVAERFTWRAVGDEMEQAYQQIMSDQKRRSDVPVNLHLDMLEDTRT